MRRRLALRTRVVARALVRPTIGAVRCAQATLAVARKVRIEPSYTSAGSSSQGWIVCGSQC